MRILSAAILCLLAAGPAGAQDWTDINLGTTSDLRAIQQKTYPLQYILGTDGFVARADDTTLLSWTTIDVGSTADLLAVHEPSGGQVWISGTEGTCRRLVSPDWIPRNLPSPTEGFVVFSRSSGQSYAAGDAGSLYRSTDSGVNWTLQATGPPLHDGDGFVSSSAVCVGDGGTVLKTTTGGAVWATQPSGTTENLYAYRDVALNHIVCAGANGTIIRSTDTGVTWTTIPSGTTATLRDLDTSGASAFFVLAVGTGGTAIYSEDAGLTWCPINTGTTADLYACDMINNTTWLIAGAGGVLRLTTNAGGGCSTTAVEGAGEAMSWGRIKGRYRPGGDPSP